MNLLKYIELAFASERPAMSSSAADKSTDLQRALRAYAADATLECALLTHFLQGFATYLTADYGYGATTAAEVLRTLRRYLRRAIRDGLVPNIDLVPQVLSTLTGADMPQRALHAGVRRDVEAALQRLEAWSRHEREGGRRERAEALQARSTAVYMFCVLNGGIPLEQALKMGPGEGIMLNPGGIQLPIVRASLRLASIYNGGRHSDRYLFNTLDDSRYGGDAAKAAKLISGHAARWLKEVGSRLTPQRPAVTPWLGYALELGLTAAEGEYIWRWRCGGSCDAAASRAALRAAELIDRGRNALQEHWYLLRMTAGAPAREHIVDELVRSGMLGNGAEAECRLYAPEERHGGAASVMRRYLFFRGTVHTAQMADTLRSDAYVMRTPGGEAYATVQVSELEALQIMLRDFPEAVGIVDGTAWLASHNAEIVEGCRAVIRSGSLRGKEARVVRVRGRVGAETTYLLEYVEGAIRFQTDLAGVELEIVRD